MLLRFWASYPPRTIRSLIAAPVIRIKLSITITASTMGPSCRRVGVWRVAACLGTRCCAGAAGMPDDICTEHGSRPTRLHTATPVGQPSQERTLSSKKPTCLRRMNSERQ